VDASLSEQTRHEFDAEGAGKAAQPPRNLIARFLLRVKLRRTENASA
jgi:hypothetical protein